MKTSKNAITFLVLISALVVQMMRPIAVRADGEVTPDSTETPEVSKTPVATDIVPTETPTDAPTDPVTIETPTVSDAPTPDPIITETPIPATGTEPPAETPAAQLPVDDEERKSATEASQTETPTPEPTDATATPEATEPSAAYTSAEKTLLETVAEIPGDTDVMVLDENGELLSLASQAAANVVAESDPMWCPNTLWPRSVGCIAAPNVGTLISQLGTSSGPGTIYFEANYNINDVILDHDDPNLRQLTELIIQGGWNGGSGKSSVSGNTDFSVPIVVLNWTGTVTIRNVTVDSATGVGLGVVNSNVTVDDSRITNTWPGSLWVDNLYFGWGDGIDIYNGGNVTIIDSNISNNNYDGIYGDANSFTFNGSTFISNGQNRYGRGVLITRASTVTFGPSPTTFNNPQSDIIIICPNRNFDRDFQGEASLQNIVIDANCRSSVVVPGNPGTFIDKVTPPPNNQVFVPASSSKVSFYLDCSRTQRSFTINLPNGDKVEIVCPVDGKASITRMDNTTLPGPLPDGYTFASAFQLEILQVIQPPQREGNDFKRWSIPFIEEGGHVKVSFQAPSPEVGNNYSILYWDNGTWITLKDFMLNTNSLPESFSLNPGADPPDERIILSGVELVNRGDGDRVEVSTNFPGIFVLAQR